MKVLHVINVRWFNASAWYAYRLALGGKNAGDTSAIAGMCSSPVTTMALSNGLTTLEADFNSSSIFKVIKSIRKTLEFFKSFKPDVVVCHRGEFFWWFCLYKYIFKPDWKLVRVRGDIRMPTKDIVSQFFHNDICYKVITSAELIKCYFTGGLNSKNDHVDVIYGGVDTDIFKIDADARHDIRKEFNFSDDDYVVAIVGRYDPVKGHEILIKAVAKLYDEGMQNIRLLIIGFPENISASMIEDMLTNNKIKNITTLTGRRCDVHKLMNASDLGVISSLGSEAICRVGMEFMACGTPIIASDVGVLPEMLPASNIYKRHNFNELAKKIQSHEKFIKVYSQKDFYNDFLNSIK